MNPKTADQIMCQEIMYAIECNKQKIEEISRFKKKFVIEAGEWKTIEIEPLISPDIFFKAQEVLKAHKVTPPTASKPA